MVQGLTTAWVRGLVYFLCLSATLFCAGCSEAPPKEVLRVLAWPGYADPDLVARFEKLYNVKVDVAFIGSDDELWTKLTADTSERFDVFAVNTAELKRYIDAEISVPIDVKAIPNTEHQLDRFQDRNAIPGIVRDGKVFAIPYTYSAMGLIYDRDKVTAVPDSMAAMWDRQYRGRVLAYDGSNHNFTVTGLILGYKDPFHLNDDQFRQVVSELIKLRRNVLTFYNSPEEAVELYRNNDIALIFGNYGTQQVKQLRDAGANIGYVIPKEGALAWLDCWSMTRYAQDRPLAEHWINFMLEKDVSSALTQRQGLANTVVPSASGMDSGKIIWIEPVEDFSKRASLWAKIRSGDTPELF